MNLKDYLTGVFNRRHFDEALQREVARLAREGGEEFTIIMPQTGKKSATMVAERVREAISALRIPHCQSALGHVTISIGVAALDAASAQSGLAACKKNSSE